MKTQFVTDNEGNKLAVILPIQEYHKLIEELEELEDIRLFDQAKEDDEPSIPLEEAFAIIEKQRQNKD